MSEDELFLTAILNCSRSELYTHPQKLTEQQKETLERMRWRRAAGEPIQYIVGFTEFMGHRINVGPGVLVPRPETEVLTDVVIKEFLQLRRPEYFVLDIGTGSACIPIALLKALPNSRAVGIDISDEALKYARENVTLNKLDDRLTIVKKDMFWYMHETVDRFDAVISNPPYIPEFMLPGLPEDVKKEPELALDGGPDGLHFYRFIIPTAHKVLKSGGFLALEFGDGQRKELENLFLATGPWDKMTIHKDNAGKNRIVTAIKV